MSPNTKVIWEFLTPGNIRTVMRPKPRDAGNRHVTRMLEMRHSTCSMDVGKIKCHPAIWRAPNRTPPKVIPSTWIINSPSLETKSFGILACGGSLMRMKLRSANKLDTTSVRRALYESELCMYAQYPRSSLIGLIGI